MIYKASLKLTTNFLGGGSRQKGASVRPLTYTEDGLVAINEEEWRSNIALALKQLNLKFDIKKFIFESGFNAEGKVMVLKRVYNKVNIDLFEGIERGNTIDIQFVYKDEVDNAPSVKAVKKLLNIIGKFYGMSQWGTKFHCGRFSVKEVKRITYE
tara:strand:+ start:888 stop:1352 length:465 start_codon:yes stop_codon:yes gene_type:complete